MLWLKIMQAEFYKIRKTKIWVLLFLSPLITGGLAFITATHYPEYKQWQLIYSVMVLIHGMLFLPLLTGIFTAFICRYEHSHGGWKQILVQPITRYHLYVIKFFFILLFTASVQILFGISFVIVGWLSGVTGSFPIDLLLKGLVGGWIATLPLIALQLWVSTIWSSFAAPIALNVIATIPALIISQSERFAPFYPWSQPFKAMIPPDDPQLLFISIQTLVFVIMGSFVCFFIGGFMHFMKKAY
ncbi:ABC transporter permease [Bacillus sp. DX1.1]|uniref:ABC transporter permease n=1 Tax=unclassified Bacillus (in: firmicutes) TaxID=185979 RepID=UPI002570FCA4|nr:MULTISPECIES: ABC transporter permease [unclassified Bacillus (in: firmicutes)]MDM5154385.1 ABC transporter permease [Bacillus sp. DX1.1]WJE83292.1 ABC transporter permease [Bacillus sp. DX3.1]